MGFWDFVEDVSFDLKMKAGEILDEAKNKAEFVAAGFKELGESIADGTLKEETAAWWHETKEELGPQFKDLVESGKEEIKKNPLKAAGVIGGLVATPFLAAGAAGATVATLARLGLAAGATKIIEEIRNDQKLDDVEKEAIAATTLKLTQKYEVIIAELREVTKDHKDIVGSSICVYLAVHSWHSRGKTKISEDTHNEALILASGLLEKAQKRIETLTRDYKDQILSKEEAIQEAIEQGVEQDQVEKIFEEIYEKYDQDIS